VSLGKLKEIQNGGKKTRRGIDQWDRVGCLLSGALGSLANSCAAKYDRSTSHDLMAHTERTQ
jgi:hypothetical protein